MISKISLVAGVLAASCATASFAGSSIAIVDMELIFKSAPQIKVIDTQLKQQFQGRQAKLQVLQGKLEKDQKMLKKNQAVMKKSKLKTLQATFATDMQAFQTERGSYKKAVYAAQTAAMGKFTANLKEVIAQVAHKKHYDFVFPKREALYAATGTDLTQSVLSALKKNRKAK